MKGVFVNDSGVFNAAGDYWVGCVPVKNLKDSKDVQQVKAGDKGKHGVTNPITGEFQQETEAIYVWRRKNGDLEVISGRHKFALALETNTPSVLCYVFNEDAKHDAKWARLLDFENNMRSDQADELTCGIYVRETGYDDATLRKKGLMRNKSRSKRGILIGRAARGELWGRFKSGTVKPKDAEMICLMTKDIADESRIDAIQRECCELLEQRKSWEYISAMVQLMASEENVQISQGLFDFGVDFHEQMERMALFVEKNLHALNDAISVMKQGRKLATTKKDLAERLGTATTTREGSGKLLQDLIELKARYENFGLYPELTEAARLWDGKSEPDPIAQAMGLTDAENERLAAEAGMSREEWEEAQRVAEAKREAEKATGSLFGDGGSFSIATESAQRVKPTPKEAFTRMDVDGPGMSSAEYGKLSKEERKEKNDQYALLSQDEKEKLAAPGLDAVYAKAAEAQEDFRKIVEGVGAKLGLKVMMRTGLKGRERAMQKTTTDNKGDAGQLLDVYGGTLILTKDDDFAAAVEELRRSGVKIARIKNGYQDQNPYGYADIKVNLEMPNGFIGEVILIEDVMNEQKFGIGHKIYEAGRDIQSELDDNEKNPDYDPERRKLATELVEALQRWSTACYTRQPQEVLKTRIEETLEAHQRGLAYILHSSREDNGQAALATEGEWINSEGSSQREESSPSSKIWKISPERLIPQAPSWSPLVQNLIKSASSALNIENSIDTRGRNVNQENTGSASFSVIGPHARTWDKHADRAFAGRDDGKMRAEIDASQAKLKGAWTAPRLEQEDIYALLGTLADGNEQVEQLIKFRHAWDRYLELIRNEAHLTEKEKAELRGMKNWVPDTRNELTELADRVLKELGYDTTITKRSANRVEALRSAALMADVKTLKKYNKYRKDNGRKLGDILDYPELFDAYPELKEMKVDGGETQANGSFSPSTRTISLNKSLFADPDKLRSTLLHEIQHAIQDIEGFAKGSNAAAAGTKARRIAAAKNAIWLARSDLNTLAALPEEARNIDLSTKDGRKKLEGVKDKLKQKRDELQEEHWRKKAEEHRGSTKKEREEEDALLEQISACTALLARASEKRGKNAGEIIDSLKEEIKQTRARLREVHGVRQSLSDYELYRRTPGEIESRNVQERRDWTAEQRQATPFNDTLEYPGEAVNFGSFSVAEAKEKKLFDENGVMQAANGILIDGTSFSYVAMHASPHWFLKFLIDKMGTGEGNQAYGAGMYFTESEGVNDNYLQAFEEDGTYWLVNGKKAREKEAPSLIPGVSKRAVNYLLSHFKIGTPTLENVRGMVDVHEFFVEQGKSIISELEEEIRKENADTTIDEDEEYLRRLKRERLDLMTENLKRDKKLLSGLRELEAWLKAGNTLERKVERIPAYNYRVEIDAEDYELLWWDDGMDDKSNAGAWERIRNSPVEEVRKLADALKLKPYALAEEVYTTLTEQMRQKHGLGNSRKDDALAQKYASEALLASGIKGHKYADGFTRHKPRSEWLYNSVVYDMDAIRITHVARGNRDWKPAPREEEEGGFSASLVDMARDARFMLRRREDDIEGEELVERWDWMLARLETAGTESGSRRDGSARMGAITALLEATRSVLPPKYAKLGRLNMLMKWAAVYAHMVSTGEVKRDGTLKGPVFEKFAAAMMEKSAAWREDGLLEGMTEEEAKDALRQLGEVRLDEALLKVAKECRARLDKFVKARARERIELTAERTWPKKERGRKSPRGKMEAERYRGMNAMLAWMDASADEVSRRQDEIRARLDKLEGEEPLDEDKAAEKTALEEEMRIIQLFGDWEGMTAQQARIAADDFNEYVLTGRHKWEEKIERERRRREWEKMNMDFSEESDANTRSAQKREGGLKNLVKHGIKTFATNTMSYSQLMLAAKRVFGERFTRERVQEIADANAALRRARRDRDDAFARALMKATGLTGKAELTDWLNRFGKEEKHTGIILRQVTNRTLEMTRDEARAWVNMTAGERERKRQELREEAERERLSAPNIPEERDMDKLREELERLDSKKSRAAKVKIKVPRRGKAIELTASRDAVANALLLLEQEDYRHLIEYEGLEPRDAQGNVIDREKDTETPIDIDQTLKPLRDFIGEDGVRFVRALQEYVGKNGREMQKVYEDRQGVPFPMKRGYWRGNFNINTVKEKDTLTEQNGMMGGGGYGFLIDRVKHYNRLEWTNTATMVFGVTVEQQNNYEPRTAQSAFIALRT